MEEEGRRVRVRGDVTTEAEVGVKQSLALKMKGGGTSQGMQASSTS